MSGLSFDHKRRGRRSSMAGPVASGRFAHLEMQDRQRMREQRRRPAQAPPRPEHVGDLHRDPTPRLLEAWQPVRAELLRAVDESTYRIWLAPVHPHALIGGTWRLACSEPRLPFVAVRHSPLW